MDTSSEKNLNKKVSANWNKLKKTFCNKLVISDIISPELFNDYINQGWESITDSYKGKTYYLGKKTIENSSYFDNLSNAQKKLTLEILGSIRRYMVDITFKYIGETKIMNTYHLVVQMLLQIMIYQFWDQMQMILCGKCF